MVEPTLLNAMRSGGRIVGGVRQHEIMRISAVIGGATDALAASSSRQEVLRWAQKRCGGHLPKEAWNCESFEYLSGGRNSTGIRLINDQVDAWAIRAEDPDKTVAGRVWTTEVIIALGVGLRPRLSVRLLTSSPEIELSIEPHSPGFINQISEQCGLFSGNHEFNANPVLIQSNNDLDQIADLLSDASRAFPVFMLSLAAGEDDPGMTRVDAKSLAKATLGIGQVVIIPDQFTWRLRDKFGPSRSLHSGAVRAYLPGFSLESNPYDHRLILGNRLTLPDERSRAQRWMRSIAAYESIKRYQLGRDIIAFSSIRDASLKFIQETLGAEGASDTKRLEIASARIAALEAELEKERSDQEFYALEADREADRASAAEAQYRASIYRIQQLREQLKLQGEVEPEVLAPVSWSELANWCDTELAGRLSLAPAARRNSKSPEFADIELMSRCLLWLSTTYRDGRINGATGDFRDFYLEDGIKNSPCGGDEFDFNWQGRKETADWHIKNGGNTRDPKLCLRIYYFWDPEAQQIVVADMPGHRTNEIT